MVDRRRRAGVGDPAPARRRLRAPGVHPVARGPRRAPSRRGGSPRPQHPVERRPDGPGVRRAAPARAATAIARRRRRVDGGGVDAWQAASPAAVAEWSAAERLRAAAPPGRLIDSDLERVAAEVDAIAAAAECCGLDRIAVLAAGTTIDIDLELAVTGSLLSQPTRRRPGSLRLTDSVGGIADGVICRLQYRRPRNATLVAAAIDLAAVVLATGDDRWRAVTVTRPAQRSGTPECHLFDVVADDPPAAARALLQAAAELRVAALRGAVPVFERTTRTLYESGYIDEDELVGTDYRRGDLTDPSNHFVWGDVSRRRADGRSSRRRTDLARPRLGGGRRLGGRSPRSTIGSALDDGGDARPDGRPAGWANARRGQRRHRQDLRDRRARRPLRGRRPRSATTSPRGWRSTRCSSSRTPAPPPPSCATASATSCSAPPTTSPAAPLPPGDDWLRVFDAGSHARSPAPHRAAPPAPSPASTRRRSRRFTASASRPGPERVARRVARLRPADRGRPRADHRGRPRSAARPPRRRPARPVARS